ncbi:MAG: type II toxin-antitoxin system RelE/ParE family toxin [Planctomycetes bacterium]|nr:type II toxin-antitoxin system RelE/ParE family toxin [Planctomycetota bacterium]
MASDGPGSEHQIVFARSARRELEDLPRPLGLRVLRRIESLAATPRPRGCRKLVGSANLWRIRIGDYRVIYGIDDAQRMVDIVAIRHRRDAY